MVFLAQKDRYIQRRNDSYLSRWKIFIRDRIVAFEFLDAKIKEFDSQIKQQALQDKYAKLLVTVPGISYYGALLISSEIADIKRFPDPEHLCSYAKLAPGLINLERLNTRT